MGNEPSAGVQELERRLRVLSQEWTTPRVRECLYCFVYRMLEFGCHGLVFARRYRDLRAPRATGLERRLGARGGFCDCEIFVNVIDPHPSVLVPSAEPEPDPGPDPDGLVVVDDPVWPDLFPACGGVRAGSTVHCTLWISRRRW